MPALCFGSEEWALDQKALPVASCAAEDLPSWFADLARGAKLTWNWGDMTLKTSLRAKKRARIEAWLRGG